MSEIWIDIYVKKWSNGLITLSCFVAALTKDWSDHALWWPERNSWLSRTRATLDQCGVAADSLLHFTPMHKALRVQLPDLRYLNCQIDFSVKTFNAVIALCKELGEIKQLYFIYK